MHHPKLTIARCGSEWEQDTSCSTQKAGGVSSEKAPRLSLIHLGLLPESASGTCYRNLLLESATGTCYQSLLLGLATGIGYQNLLPESVT